MAQEVILPRQGQSVESCLIAAWHVEEGDTVEEGQVICEVETDKASFEVEATASGTVVKRYFAENDDVPVLTTLAMIGEPGEGVPASPPTVAGSQEASSAPAPAQPAPAQTSAPASSPTQPAASAPAPVPGGSGKLRISPRAKKLADRLGVDPGTLAGTGPGGRVIVRDVEGAESRPAEAPTSGSYPGPAQELPLKGARKVTAERMLASLQNTAQLTLNRSADARTLLALRRRLKERQTTSDGAGRITLNDMVLFAVSRALSAHPEMNAHLDKGLLRRFAHVHLGFAVDTEKGLYVPTIRNAQAMSLSALSAEAKRLSELCLAGKAGTEELVPATFTVTNLGTLGVESFTPVLNPPQIGILGVSAVVPTPRTAAAESIRAEDLEWIPSLGLSLTIDHQGIDGAPAARFLRTVAEYIADFDLTLTA